jgi:hypothetical protein
MIALLTGFLDVAPRLVTSRATLGPLLSLSILDTDASNPLCYNKRRENVQFTERYILSVSCVFMFLIRANITSHIDSMGQDCPYLSFLCSCPVLYTTLCLPVSSLPSCFF